jgi:hypothetical protein
VLAHQLAEDHGRRPLGRSREQRCEQQRGVDGALGPGSGPGDAESAHLLGPQGSEGSVDRLCNREAIAGRDGQREEQVLRLLPDLGAQSVEESLFLEVVSQLGIDAAQCQDQHAAVDLHRRIAEDAAHGRHPLLNRVAAAGLLQLQRTRAALGVFGVSLQDRAHESAGADGAGAGQLAHDPRYRRRIARTGFR